MLKETITHDVRYTVIFRLLLPCSVDNVLKAPLFPNMDLKSPSHYAAQAKRAFKSPLKSPNSYIKPPSFNLGAQSANVYADGYGEGWDVQGNVDDGVSDHDEYYDAVASEKHAE